MTEQRAGEEVPRDARVEDGADVAHAESGAASGRTAGEDSATDGTSGVASAVSVSDASESGAAPMEPEHFVAPFEEQQGEQPVFDIEIERFTHNYGSFKAVDNLNLRIPRGTITGFIGPNGAGKTTTMQLLCTLLHPTRGDARICGHSCRRERQAVRRIMGFMPDSFGVYEGLTSRDYLRFFAEACSVPKAKIASVIDGVVELLRLQQIIRTPVDGLSRGQLQRLSLARTLLHDPQVLILDEPASGLDPVARLEFFHILRELRAMGKTLFLSSHILSEVAECCDYLAILSRGRLVAFDHLDEIRHRVRPHYSIELVMQGKIEETLFELRDRDDIIHVRVNAHVIEFDFVGNEDQLMSIHRDLVMKGLPVVFFQPVEVRLEDAFALLVEPDEQDA